MVAVIKTLCFSMLLLSWPSSLVPCYPSCSSSWTHHVYFYCYSYLAFSSFSFILRALFIVWHILYIINVIQMCSKCGELKSTWVCNMFRGKRKKQQRIFMQINSDALGPIGLCKKKKKASHAHMRPCGRELPNAERHEKIENTPLKYLWHRNLLYLSL